MRYLTIPKLDRDGEIAFQANIADREDGCSIWVGKISTGGYGRFYYRGTQYAAHRMAYVQKNGPIPSHLVLDHLCRNRACVNPDHLEAVTQSVNVRRGLLVDLNPYRHICPEGHQITGANQMTYRATSRCRTCYNEYMKVYMRTYKPKSA